jgi:hypothetical protein
MWLHDCIRAPFESRIQSCDALSFLLILLILVITCASECQR